MGLVIAVEKYLFFFLSSFRREQLFHSRHRTIVHPQEAMGMDTSTVLPLKYQPVVFEVAVPVNHSSDGDGYWRRIGDDDIIIMVYFTPTWHISC